MISQRIRVRAASRLHFGLLSFGNPQVPEFGGAGVMVTPPGLELSAVATTGEFQADGPLAERVEQFARAWADFYQRDWPLPCRFQVHTAPPQHAGLGAGTQLGLSVAAVLVSLYGLQRPSPAELALSVGRGARSAVGTYGFLQGGLIVERGKSAGEPIGELDCRLELPAEWRFVIIQPQTSLGLHGATEKGAFAALPAVSRATRQALAGELREVLVPAAVEGNCQALGESLYRYGRRAGDCFAAFQGGSYNGELLTQMVASIRSIGVRGVGQSSWGPSLFALFPDVDEASSFIDAFGNRWPEKASLSIAAVDNVGAEVTTLPMAADQR